MRVCEDRSTEGWSAYAPILTFPTSLMRKGVYLRRYAVKAMAASLRIARGFAQSATHAGRVRFSPAPHAS